MKAGFVIPVYNHGKEVGNVVKQLTPYNLPIILVDDGSNAETKIALNSIVSEYAADKQNAQIFLVTRKKNGGKGAAVISGIEKAHELALSSVLQLDADGQHDLSRIAFFLDAAAKTSAKSGASITAVCGKPEYDDSVPESRLKGRVVGNNWAKFVTLTFSKNSPFYIADSMCGFRVYPVEKTWKIIRAHHITLDKRMGFDIEILVRLVWTGVRLDFYPVHVVYPEGALSNFHVVKDNIKIGLMFARLCCELIFRFPFLLFRKLTMQRQEAGK
ncbi:MAG: hypothetical protein Ta2A_22810 [Treponemataceae bacterium]|nr:MAG: hypothetical protein Ta2A_22810 [Treponemataceae bacterium]